MISITIKKKVASLSDPNMTAVCDNDYTIVFDFDEEWSSYANKTARFTFNDSYRDVVFSGNSVEMAYISNAPHVDIGVYAGDLCTTTPARLYMRRSIRSGTGAPADPEHDVYDQIMEQMTNVLDGAEEATERAESAQAAAETAESNAEIAEGNAESAQAAAEAAKTAAETAETNAETAQAATEAAKTSVEATAAAFDSNAAAKTTAFDSNAATKTGNFDTNATAKSTAFNENATTKTTAFDENANSKTTSFNSNATTKTTAFDENAAAKQGAFDDNATAKTTAFNSNATTANTTIDQKVAAVTADTATVAADKATVAADKAATLAAKAAAETAETNAETAQTAAEAAEDNAAASATAAAASAVSADYLPNTANALKRAISGTVVRMDDVSPLNHNLSFKQYGQCVQNGTPTPAAPIEILGKAAGGSVCGKNLFNISKYTNITDFDTSGFSNEVYPAGTYTFNSYFVNENGSVFIRAYTSDKTTTISTSSALTSSGILTFTFTATTEWRFRIGYNGWASQTQSKDLFSGSQNAQLELGSTATEYEPYQAPITQTVTDSNGDPVTLYGIPVSSGGNVTINGQQYIADTVEGTTLTRRAGQYVVDSSDISSTDGGYNEAYTNLNCVRLKKREVDKAYGNQSYYPVMSNIAEFSTFPNGYDSATNIDKIYVAGKYMYFVGFPKTTTKAEALAEVIGSTICYQLATPTTETVTLAPATISANSPTTTVTAEAYTDTTYNRDAIKVIDELTAAIVALGGNI